MPFISLADHRIRFEDTGGDKPAIVFCHSFGMRSEMFEPQVAAFKDEYRCITWDQRAHGESPAGQKFTFWDSAQDLFAILDHLGIEKAAVVGTSQGGFVALRAALLHPERVSAVAVFGTSSEAEEEASKKAYQPLSDLYSASSYSNPPTAAVDAISAICLGTKFDSSQWKRVWMTWSPAQFDLAFQALTSRDSIGERLAEVQGPVLVLHGTADMAYPTRVGKKIADGLPNAIFEQIADGQHFLSLTDSVAVNSALKQFLLQHPY